MTEAKVCSWLQDDLLQRTIKPYKRGQRALLGKRKRKLEAEEEEEEEEEAAAGAAGSSSEEKPRASLKYETIQVYLAAVAELYKQQVTRGVNSHPTFRGAAVDGFLSHLQRSAYKQDRETYQDRGAGGINSGYDGTEFLTMSEQLLKGADKHPQVSSLSSLLPASLQSLPLC